MTGTVLIVGSINIDLAVQAPRHAAPGETISGDAFTIGLGGKGANQAVAVARAGARAVMAGRVGTDDFAHLALQQLVEAGVDASLVETADGASGIAHIRVAEAENSIVVVPNANAMLTAEDTRSAVRQSGASVLLTQLETSVDVVSAALAAAKSAGIVTVLDPAPAVPLPESLWQDVDIVKPNEHEAGILSGIRVHDRESAVEAARWFLARGVHTVIITLGADGAIIATSSSISKAGVAAVRTVEGHRVDAVDSTAAGDSFTGALAAFVAGALGDAETTGPGIDRVTSEMLDTALARAMAAGAISVTRHGSAVSVPTKAEVDVFLSGHASQTAQPIESPPGSAVG